MKAAESLKNLIAENIGIFTEKNVFTGSVDLSRTDNIANVCVIIPESEQITDSDIGGGYEVEISFTVSMIFRNGKHFELVERMERTAEEFSRLVLSDYTLGGNVTDIIPGKTKFFYDCGAVEQQATGLDIELTITETREKFIP